MSKNVKITLYKSEIIYDVQNRTFLTGKSRENGNNHEQVANMQMGDEEEQKNQVLRSIGNALDSLKVKLSNYLVNDALSSNNILLDDEDNKISVDMVMPENYNLSANETVKGAMHKYVVNMSLFDWYTITKPDEAANFSALAQANLEEMREAINKRIRPQRTTPDA